VRQEHQGARDRHELVRTTAGGVQEPSVTAVFDPFEKDLIRSLNIKVFPMAEIRGRGMSDIAAEIVRVVGDHPLHVCFDIDRVDPNFAPATGVPVPNGINVEDLKTLGRQVANACRLTSLDVVEINPALGAWEQVAQTYLAAMHFLIALLHPQVENREARRPSLRRTSGPPPPTGRCGWTRRSRHGRRRGDALGRGGGGS
jgi:arginase family enzyme